MTHEEKMGHALQDLIAEFADTVKMVHNQEVPPIGTWKAVDQFLFGAVAALRVAVADLAQPAVQMDEGVREGTVWLVTRNAEVDGVTVTSVLGAFATEESAKEAIRVWSLDLGLRNERRVSLGIEDFKVKP